MSLDKMDVVIRDDEWTYLGIGSRLAEVIEHVM